MISIKNYSFEDGAIKEIRILNNCVEVKFSLWNEKVITLLFRDYWKIEDSHSIDTDISQVKVSQESLLMKEVISEILDGNGTEDEAKGLKHYSFWSSWGDRVVFEIIARDLKISEETIPNSV